MEELRTLLLDEFEGYSQMSSLPSLKVSTHDDITSGLTVLRDYVTIMSQDVIKNSSKGESELKKRVGEMEGQLKRSEEQVRRLEDQVKQLKSEVAGSSKLLESTREERDSFIAEATDLKHQVRSDTGCHGYRYQSPWLQVHS